MKKRTARGLFYFPDPKNRPQAHTFGCDAFQFLAQPGRVSASDCVGAGTESRPYGFHKTESQMQLFLPLTREVAKRNEVTF